ncbi:MAG: hypothetical protein H7641_11525 [Candidatus Heimdallarchaeota archaeon]|nr:hypothetical protein [Candidatus Heimdallarchaeota archaeon]
MKRKNASIFRKSKALLALVIILSTFIPTTLAASPVICYAIIIDQFAGNSNNPVNSSGTQMVEELLQLGWENSLIATFYGESEISKNHIDNEMSYIQVNIDANDLLFIFINVEGQSFLNDTLDFDTWFPEKFLEIKTAQKIILIESSQSGASIEELIFTDGYGLSSVSTDEKNIRFTEHDLVNWTLSENPFIGGISAHFWIDAINNISADISGDDVVTMDEVNSFSLAKIRSTYNEMFNDNLTWASEEFGITDPNNTVYPKPLSYNFHAHNLTLNATDFIINNANYVNPSSFWIPSLVVASIIIPLVIFELYSYRRRLKIRRESKVAVQESEESEHNIKYKNF